MDFSSTPFQMFSAALVLIMGLFVVAWMARLLGTPLMRAFVLYFWHTAFCIVNFLLSLESPSDSAFYYTSSLYPDVEFGLGSKAVSYITSFFSSWLGFSYLGVFLLFNIFGAVGLLAYDAALRRAVIGKGLYLRLMVMALVFMPSVSFWSCALSKDAITFMAIGLILWSAADFGKRLPLIAFSVGCIFLVRPHIAAVLLMAVAIAFLFYRRIPLAQRAMLGVVVLVSAALLAPLVLSYVGFGDGVSSDAVSDFVELRQSYYQDTNAGIDISSMSLPMQMFTYVFRPLPFEANSLFSLVASSENAFLLLIFILGAVACLRKRGAALPESWIFLVVYAVSAWIVLAMTTANLGIAVRQKWMFAPMLILLVLSALAAPRRIARQQAWEGGSR